MRWTLEQLKHLRDLEAPIAPGAKIVIAPVSKGNLGEGFGTAITWIAMLYRRGVMGPRAVNELELRAVGLGEGEAQKWVSQVERALTTLNALYPEIQPAIAERVEAIKADIPVPLPEGLVAD